MIELKQ